MAFQTGGEVKGVEPFQTGGVAVQPELNRFGGIGLPEPAITEGRERLRDSIIDDILFSPEKTFDALEQGQIASELIESLTDPEDAARRFGNRLMLSAVFGVPFENIQFMEQPMLRELFEDDLVSLKKRFQKNPVEGGFFKKMGEAVRRGNRNVTSDIAVYQAAFENKGDVDEILKARAKHQLEETLSPIEGNLITNLFYKSGQILPGMVRGYWDAIPEALVGMTTGITIAAVAGQTGPQIALPEEVLTVPIGAVTGLKIGLSAGSAHFWYKQGAGAFFAAMMDKELDPEVSRTVAGVAAIPYAIVELLQVQALTPGLRKGVENIGRRTMLKVIAQATKTYGSTYTQEVLEEIAQEIIQISAEDIAQYLSENGIEINAQFIQERAGRVWTTAKESAQALALLPIPGAAIDINTGRKQVLSQQKINAINAKTAEFEQALDSILPESVKKEAGLPAEKRPAEEAPKAVEAARIAEPPPEGIKVPTKAELEALPYKELQQQAKTLGIKANQKKEALIEQIIEAQPAEAVPGAQVTEEKVQPFQLTKAEFTGTDAEHKKLVIQAVREGKDVPVRVLEDYKDEKWAARAIVRAETGLKMRPAPELPSPEATQKAELKKDAAVIKEAQDIDKTVETLRKEITELEKLRAENKKLEGTPQFDADFDKDSAVKIQEKTKEADEKVKAVTKKLRDRINDLATVKGLSKKALSNLSLKHTNFRTLTGKVAEKKININQLVKLLEAVEKARPTIIGHRRVLSLKTENQIAAFKESLIKAGRLTESEFNRILGLVTSKGFGQVGLGRPRPAKFISAKSFITQTEARDLLDRMHDSAQVIGITEPLNKAVEKNPEIKAELEKVRSQPSSIGDPSSKTISNRIRNAVFGTDFFDRLYSMRFWSQRLGDRMAQPVYKVYRSLIREAQILTRERGKVFEFLGTLPDFDKIAADNEALQRVSDAIASKSNLKNKPEFPKNITKSELRLVAEIEKIFKVYEFHAKVGKFFQHKDDLTRMPQYLKFKKGIDRALDIYDTKGIDALFDYIKTQDWGIITAGYEPMRSVIRKISTHQMPDVAVGKSHIKVRGIEYAQQDRNILQRLQSYMRQMDMLAFVQPKIKAWVRLIGDNLESIENQDNVQQVITTFLNNLKKTNMEDGFIEQVMRRIYSQAITTRVLADPIKPGRNLLQNVSFAEDRADLFDPRNKSLTPQEQEYLETYVQQDRVMMSDWAFAGEEPLNLPVIGQKRLGIDKVTKWTQKHSLYPASDRKNRYWSFWAKINRARRAFAKDQTLAEKMLEARFSDMQRSEQELALEILAKDGIDSMARFVAQVHTDNTHFLYAREARSPAEQTRVGKLIWNLFLFKRAAVEKAVLQIQKATGQGSLQSRLRAANVLVRLFVMSAITNWIWKELTGKKHGAYDFINFLEVNAGGLELASVEKVETVYNLMIRAALKGDTKALAALPRAITTSADYFIPYYDLGMRAIEATLDEKNLDIQALQKIREMVDKEYRIRGRPRIERSLLEKFQFTFGGPGVDKKEEK